MTTRVTIPLIGADRAWRDAARGFLAAGTPPEDITWGTDTVQQGLFDTADPRPAPAGTVTVPRRFVSLANTVVWHSAPDRFACLYAALWRVHRAPALLQDRGDAQIARLMTMEKNVRRCQHKMKAFVRFREIGAPDAPRRSFAAWFEPTHFTVEPTAEFFRRRFGDMNWRILTPHVSAVFEDGRLKFEDGHPAPDLPVDAHEGLWVTYFQNIFNPARLKVAAMQSEMPRKYWKNMPEAAAIPQLIETAEARARAMAAAAPSLPPARMDRVQAQQKRHVSAWAEDRAGELSACTRCPLHAAATQVVPGEGPLDAALVLLGEQPGDQEDLAGRPFVGPAGQVLDAALNTAGIDRAHCYLTNAVKHFKYIARGRRRLHQRPNASEISHCKWWLEEELRRIRPRLVLAMGATAARALTGDGDDILQRRGKIERGFDGQRVLVTLHPAALLRMSDPNQLARMQADFADDLELAAQMAFAQDHMA